MASNQNQGMLIALIIFVILAVISMGLATVFFNQSAEMTKRFTDAKKTAEDNQKAFFEVQNEANELKDIILPAKNKAGDDRATLDEIKAKYKADLVRYGERLKAIEDKAKTELATYSQSLAAAVTTLEERNSLLDTERAKVDVANKAKAGLEATYEAQVKQFKDAAMAVETEKLDIQAKLTKVEEEIKKVKLENTTIKETANTDAGTLRAEMQKSIDEKDVRIKQLETSLAEQVKQILIIKKPEYAANFDGQVTKINPSARTVWVNVGTYDRLPKNLTFSVQAQGVPATSNLKPKAKIEVIELLSAHLAECRIIEDDLRNPILVGDNIFTNLWEPGQVTRFAFAGKIDIDNDGGDDMDRVRSLVARAGGQIDAEVVNGEIKGQLSIETRFLVLGTLPADKASAERYQELINKAIELGVQRVPMGVFFDQIGYKTEAGQTVQYGGSSNNLRPTEKPDGGAPVSTGSVTPAFTKRRPPAAAANSAF